MVCVSHQLYNRARRLYSKSFIDKVRIYVRGGSGGNGLPTLGGDGGKGGRVYIVASPKRGFTLTEFKQKHPTKRFVADNGQNSHKRSLTGLNGASIYIPVPHGVSVNDADTDEKLGEISTPLDKVMVAKGGAGGCSFNGFVPSKGQRRNIFLDLKLIADVGFVGFPNAGKSTLLTRLSKAQPKIAEYAFTTIKPEMGVIEYPDFRKIQVADLPGLIEGAHANKGRGHVFLKHIERTHILLFVVDVTGFQLSPKSDFRDAFETVQLLTKELEIYDSSLLKRPALLAVNKMDKKKSTFYLDRLKQKLENWEDHVENLPNDMIPSRAANIKDILPISALEDRGIANLKIRIREEIDKMVKTDRTRLKLDPGREFDRLDESKETEKFLM